MFHLLVLAAGQGLWLVATRRQPFDQSIGWEDSEVLSDSYTVTHSKHVLAQNDPVAQVLLVVAARYL